MQACLSSKPWAPQIDLGHRNLGFAQKEKGEKRNSRAIAVVYSLVLAPHQTTMLASSVIGGRAAQLQLRQPLGAPAGRRDQPHRPAAPRRLIACSAEEVRLP
jgi:hypothetical protein